MPDDNLVKLLIFNDEIYHCISREIYDRYSGLNLNFVNDSLELLDNFCESDCFVSFDTIFDL